MPGTVPDCSPALESRSCHLFELFVFLHETRRGLRGADAVQKTDGLQEWTPSRFAHPDSLVYSLGLHCLAEPPLVCHDLRLVASAVGLQGCEHILDTAKPRMLRGPALTIPSTAVPKGVQSAKAGVASRRVGR